MPYSCILQGRKWALQKKDGSKTFGTHDTKKACQKQLRALYANEISNEAHLRFEGELFDFPDLDSRLALVQTNPIKVIVNGRGGSADAAIGIHNSLRNSGKRIIVYVPAVAYSAHAILMLAGDEIYIAENGLIMFHPPEAEIQHGETKSQAELQQLSERLGKYKDVLITTLMSKTKRSETECKEMMSKDTWFTAKEALEFGLVDDIIPILRDVEIENFFPERIVNFVKGKQQMPLKEICDQFGVSVTAENAEEKLVEFIQSLQGNQKPRTPEIQNSIVRIVQNSRETMLNSLVTTGKVIPAVVTELKTKYLAEERVKMDLQSDSTEFDNIVNALSKNEVVLSFGGKTGRQALSKEEQEKERNVLVVDAKKRATAKL